METTLGDNMDIRQMQKEIETLEKINHNHILKTKQLLSELYHNEECIIMIKNELQRYD